MTPRRSASGRFWLSFAFASCQHYETGLYTAHRHLAAEDGRRRRIATFVGDMDRIDAGGGLQHLGGEVHDRAVAR